MQRKFLLRRISCIFVAKFKTNEMLYTSEGELAQFHMGQRKDHKSVERGKEPARAIDRQNGIYGF